MRNFFHITLLLFVLSTSLLCAQTPGFNYQALILNTNKIQVPGTDIKENQVPLGLEKVVLRFTIENENKTEYSEEQLVTTDENGMVSVIVGEGLPISAAFSDIIWDGKLKYLKVEIDIISSNKGFVLLDLQKILYIPQPKQGSNVVIVNTLGDLKPPYQKGDLIWSQSYGANNNPTLLIWDGTNWTPVSNDYDPTNELGLIVATNTTDRDTKFSNPKAGDQVWNQSCGCIEVYDGSKWVSTKENFDVLNGLFRDGNTTKLGGNLIQPTVISASTTNTLAIKGLETNTIPDEDEIVVVNKNTGVLKKMTSTSVVRQEEKLVVAATSGQKVFLTPFTITDLNKINVYRNGVRIDFTAVNNQSIEIEPEAICFPGDEIRIIQIN